MMEIVRLKRYSTLIAVTALGLASLCSAKIIRVDHVTGDDANDGESAPVKSFAHAVTLLAPGDTLSITPTKEPYRETLRLDIEGTPGAPIIVEGNRATIELGEDISDGPWTQAGEYWSYPTEEIAGKQAAFAFYRGNPISRMRKPLQPGETPPDFTIHDGEPGTVWIRFPEGMTPPFTGLYKPGGNKCVYLAGTKHVRIRNLNVRGAANDGFGLHGEVEDVIVENCTAILCGDEGTSAHGKGQAEFRDCLFAWNGSWSGGVTDVHETETDYIRCISAFGRGPGFALKGAKHKLIDSYSLGNDRPEDKASLPPASVEKVNFVDITGDAALTEIQRLALENSHMAQLLTWREAVLSNGAPAE